jgi:hypothetical protein
VSVVMRESRGFTNTDGHFYGYYFRVNVIQMSTKSRVIGKLYEQMDWSKRDCGVGTSIPRFKSHGFRYLGIFEIAGLFGETNRFGTSQTTDLG